MTINGLSTASSAQYLNSSLRIEPSKHTEAASIKQRLASSDSYQPDFFVLDTMKEGDVGSLTGWTESQMIEFNQQTTETILKNIDFTNTTKDELFATISVLSRRGEVDANVGSSLAFTVGLDQNLNSGESFNALEYFEKSVKGLEEASVMLNNSDSVQEFRAGANMIKAIHNMKESGQSVMSVDTLA